MPTKGPPACWVGKPTLSGGSLQLHRSERDTLLLALVEKTRVPRSYPHDQVSWGNARSGKVGYQKDLCYGENMQVRSPVATSNMAVAICV